MVLHLVGFLQPRITVHGTTNINFIKFEEFRFFNYVFYKPDQRLDIALVH